MLPVGLSAASLAWLRKHADDADRLRAMALEMPAWIEPFAVLLGEPVSPTCPQIVQVDFPAMAFRRAEWQGGNLLMDLAPLVETPSRFTTFRIVGAEPRNWDVYGPDGATFELTNSGLNARVPMVAAEIQLIRGSY